MFSFDDDDDVDDEEEEEEEGGSAVVAGYKHRLGAPEPATPSLCDYLTPDDLEVHSRRLVSDVSIALCVRM